MTTTIIGHTLSSRRGAAAARHSFGSQQILPSSWHADPGCVDGGCTWMQSESKGTATMSSAPTALVCGEFWHWFATRSYHSNSSSQGLVLGQVSELRGPMPHKFRVFRGRCLPAFTSRRQAISRCHPSERHGYGPRSPQAAAHQGMSEPRRPLIRIAVHGSRYNVARAGPQVLRLRLLVIQCADAITQYADFSPVFCHCAPMHPRRIGGRTYWRERLPDSDAGFESDAERECWLGIQE